MNYCRRSSEGTLIYRNGKIEQVQMGIKAYINSLCRSRLTCVDTILRQTKRIFSYERMVPIYVSEHVLLFSLSSMRNFEGIWVNYMEVLEIKKKQDFVVIHFMDESKLEIETKKNYLNTQILRCKEILSYMTKKSLESVYNYGLSIEI